MTKIPSDRRQGAPNRLVLDLDDLTQADAAALDGWRDSLREPLPPDEPPAPPVRARNRLPAMVFGRRPAGQGARFRVGRRQS
jgi:hypothetical protein